jgi:hypothetical protein
LIILFGLIAGIVFLNFVGAFQSRALTYFLVSLFGLLAFGPLVWRAFGHSLDLAEPGIWFALFYFAHFGVRAVYDLIYGSSLLALDPGGEDFSLVNAALFVSILGFLAFWFGYQRRIGRAVARSLPSLPRRWNWSIVLPIALLSAALGWGVEWIVIVSQAGSLSAWVVANKDELLRLAEGTTYLEIISGSLRSIALLLLIILSKIKHKKWVWAVFGLFFVLEIMFDFVSGSRAALLFLLLKMVILFFMMSRRTYKTSLRFTYPISVLIVLGFFMFPILSTVRFLGIGSIGASISFLSLTNLFRVVLDRLHGLDSLALIMRKVPREVSYTFASELGVLAVSWIPRKIWPDKPIISLGEIFCQKMVPPGVFGESTSVAITLTGQFYWDLGVVGVLVGMTLVGVLWKSLYEYFVRPKGNLSNVLVTAVMFPSFFVPVEQDLISVFTLHLFSLLIVLIVVLFVARKTNTTIKR